MKFAIGFLKGFATAVVVFVLIADKCDDPKKIAATETTTTAPDSGAPASALAVEAQRNQPRGGKVYPPTPLPVPVPVPQPPVTGTGGKVYPTPTPQPVPVPQPVPLPSNSAPTCWTVNLGTEKGPPLVAGTAKTTDHWKFALIFERDNVSIPDTVTIYATIDGVEQQVGMVSAPALASRVYMAVTVPHGEFSGFHARAVGSSAWRWRGDQMQILEPLVLAQ